MNLVEKIINQINTTENRQKVAGAIGGNDEVAGSALTNLVPLITKALGKQGESGVSNLLEGNHSSNEMVQNLLGDKAGLITKFLGKTANVDEGESSNLLGQLIPMIMGAIGQEKQEQGLDNSQFANLLDKSNTEAAAGNSQLGMITSLLDQDGDGDISDDLLNMGKSVLGNLFK